MPTGCNYPQWILSLFKFDPCNLCRETTSVTQAINKEFKVITHDMNALYMAFLGILGSFSGLPSKTKNLHFKKALYNS